MSRTTFSVAAIAWLAAANVQAQGSDEASPASLRPAAPATIESYAQEDVDAGRARFGSQCGFCHGRDAAGGQGGPDLTRSALVSTDLRGDRIKPLLRTGRPDKGMPAFTLSDADADTIVAFVHDQQAQAADDAATGRQTIEPADLRIGSVGAGKRYFATACARCHSAIGDLKGIASKYQGLTLLLRMLYPGSGERRAGPAPAAPTIKVTLPNGKTISGRQVYRDEFTVTIVDASGWQHSWPASQIKFSVDDPLQAHVVQLAKYTNEDMHNVLAYLQTLR